MRPFLATLTVTAALLLLGPLAGGQTPPAEQPAGSTRTVNLTAEQTHVIKEIVLKDMNVSKTSDNVDVTIGATIPASIRTQPFPPEIADRVPGIKSHTFFVKDDQVVVVSPKDNTIAEVIK
jgi:hypothetical protein